MIAVVPALVDVSVADVIRVLVWRFDPAVRVVSSASVGVGCGTVGWVCNVQVPLDFAREDLDELIGVKSLSSSG